MDPTERQTERALEIRRTIRAPKEKTFAAWTDRAALSRWFAPSDDHEVVVHELDVRVGGAYRIEMRHPSGSSYTVLGIYREVIPPERLSFTWRWEHEAAVCETLVTIEFMGRGEETEILLSHRLFETDLDRDEHQKGWVGCLNRLTAII